jgi:hypothetical protein
MKCLRWHSNLEEPWELMHVEFDDKEDAWHLFIDFEHGSTFACPVVVQKVKRMMQK